MSTYAIGDLQGCLEALQRLLDLIHFDPTIDQLWFTGDLANRGPEPVETLRFVKSLKERAQCVLGNHDIALLALKFKLFKSHSQDTHHAVLTAPDSEELLDWLRQQPLMYTAKGYILVHAGIYPTWSLQEALHYAHSVEVALKSPNYGEFLEKIFAKSQVDERSEDPIERSRFIINCFTRMRFCRLEGGLELAVKDRAQHPNLLPWFTVPDRACQQERILFGHWSALKGITPDPRLIALDTGCVWGGALTAFRLEDEQRFTLPCK